MSVEDERIHINLELMFPEAARRVRVLEELKRSWDSIVGNAIAHHSRPCVLGVNKIVVSVDTINDIANVRKVKGNIMSALSSQYGCFTDNDFSLVITIGNHKNVYDTPGKYRKSYPDVKVDEEEVKKLMQGAPETLPEKINYAISHLKVFLDQKFHH